MLENMKKKIACQVCWYYSPSHRRTKNDSVLPIGPKVFVENVPTLHGAESALSEPSEHMLSVASVIPESFRTFRRLCFVPKKERCPLVDESVELGDWVCRLVFFIRVHTIVKAKKVLFVVQRGSCEYFSHLPIHGSFVAHGAR